MQTRLDEETAGGVGLSKLQFTHDLARRVYRDGAHVLLDIERVIEYDCGTVMDSLGQYAR